MADPYLVLARRWRPQTFEDVIGQQHVTRTLQNAIRSGRIGHAFLFIGSRGIGKTTSARILAKALNCLSAEGPTPEPCGTCANCQGITAGNHIDVIEIDGASNNSVEDVRQIRENVRMVPSSSRYKIYVIDEVHQLSGSAFNALLKTLEEPPPHAIFILATTEAHKIPATIISRCQRYDFRRVGLDDIVALLKRILDADGVKCAEDALYAIARAADGGVRDAETILDQLISYCDGEITFKDVFDVLGLVDWRVLHDLCQALQGNDTGKLLQIVDDIVVSGKDLAQFVEEIVRYFRNLLVCKTGAAKALLAMPEDEIRELEQQAGSFGLIQLIRIVEQFTELSSGYESQLAQRTALEALLIRMSEVSVDSIIEKLVGLKSGAGPSAGRERPVASQPAPQKGAPKSSAPAKSAAAKKNASTSSTPPKVEHTTPAHSGRVDPEAARAAMKDPHVARVVDVFKGRIVDIRPKP